MEYLRIKIHNKAVHQICAGGMILRYHVSLDENENVLCAHTHARVWRRQGARKVRYELRQMGVSEMVEMCVNVLQGFNT